ncbi:cysteine--1-D-myo-inosityl 2-amino-2-deoxy-alpha-D-glucopyranoside ligase [Nocardioides sp.]|uniref:cysteine--1-D-myo-inosityl 2-amino-2-deoxy-alpha-D-glucopyranoside ligase n=1 Tax=Nocardioides sp. TaxID=35761 RepID=UPI00286C501C|nr:cysteine--1-D-myo-inosityl 2-amino-2-deoxy-alpha-D-glucopyranoside ligase [Nocardioides sp.]
MRAWSAPEIPSLTVTGPAVALHDTATGTAVTTTPDGVARLYVCGITPYDATHMGHAATYVAFDLLNRAWRNAGHDVTFVQNVTDVDDPLLERATKVNVGWVELAERETELFRHDMTALRVIPPDHYIGAVESIPLAIELIQVLEAAGATYTVDTDVYYSVTADPAFGQESGFDRETMLALFGERGGDPDRPGKRDPLDCVVWRGEREGEPSWDSPYGPGRPGWHIECSAIAMRHLGGDFDVQGGGSDLVFPHHEMCAGHAQVAAPGTPFAQVYSHAGMVAYDGEKMSKSLGNLVFVSALRNSDVDPMGIRLALLRHHYRSDWEWTDAELWESVDTIATWRKALSLGAGAPAAPVVQEVLAAMAHDLDAPRATAAVDAWVAATLGTGGLADTSDRDAAVHMLAVIDAALGLSL